MNLLQFFFGTITVEGTSSEPPKALGELMESGVAVSDVIKKSELVYRFRIHRNDFYIASLIFQNRGDKLDVIDRQGMYWRFQSIVRRPVLIFTGLILVFITLYLPTRVLFIETEGNKTLSSREILTAAENCGISYGASRKQIRSEKVKNELLSLLPELQWAGINTVGCRAVISVKERASAASPHPENFVSNLVAQQDAFVLSSTVTEGTALVQPGDSVVAGQTLISGYTDHGFCIQAGRAVGEILGLTSRTVLSIMPNNCLQIMDREEAGCKISLLIRKKRINLWKDSRISDAGCGRMYEEYFFSLPGGFQLPVALCIDRYYRYTVSKHPITETEAYPALSTFSDAYLQSQMIAGKILRTNQHATPFEDIYQLKVHYSCSEMIGREQREQIGDQNGKRN